MDVKGTQNTLAVLTSLVRRESLGVDARWLDNLAHRLTDKIKLSTEGGLPTVVRSDGSDGDLLEYVSTLATNEGSLRKGNEHPKVERNPWSQRHWNLTQQHIITRSDPDRAAMLKRAALKANGGGDPSNPWTTNGYNLTRQMLLRRQDPERAAHLAAEAGVEL